MRKQPAHKCECPECQQPGSNPIKEMHADMNFLLSTLDERQRRLYAGLESKKIGYGGDQQIAMITGLSVNTIAKGRRELEQAEGSDRIRAPGGGRLKVEKNIR
jgi:hypothetical protein